LIAHRGTLTWTKAQGKKGSLVKGQKMSCGFIKSQACTANERKGGKQLLEENPNMGERSRATTGSKRSSIEYGKKPGPSITNLGGKELAGHIRRCDPEILGGGRGRAGK